PAEVSLPPTLVAWPTEPETLYTLLLTDADVPEAEKDILHWAVGNIAGINIATGETWGLYEGANPPKGSGVHRYVFRVYKQSEKLTLDRFKTRIGFNLEEFVAKNKLQGPLAENFLTS